MCFATLCEHHLLPFHGAVHVAYLADAATKPLWTRAEAQRAVARHGRRFQVQERLTRDIAQDVAALTGAPGDGGFSRASSVCVIARGVEKPGSTTVTSAALGAFVMCLQSPFGERSRNTRGSHSFFGFESVLRQVIVCRRRRDAAAVRIQHLQRWSSVEAGRRRAREGLFHDPIEIKTGSFADRRILGSECYIQASSSPSRANRRPAPNASPPTRRVCQSHREQELQKRDDERRRDGDRERRLQGQRQLSLGRPVSTIQCVSQRVSFIYVGHRS